MATTAYKPVHETTETVNNAKVTTTIRGSYLTDADEYTKAFINKMEKVGLYIQKSKAIIKVKL